MTLKPKPIIFALTIRAVGSLIGGGLAALLWNDIHPSEYPYALYGATYAGAWLGWLATIQFLRDIHNIFFKEKT